MLGGPLTHGGHSKRRIGSIGQNAFPARVNKGHRMRVAVTSSNTPRYDLNPGTGKPWVDGGPTVKQTNRLYCDAGHPSRIVLPVVKEAGGK